MREARIAIHLVNYAKTRVPLSLGKPRDHTDATQEIARDLVDIAGQLASLKGEAHSMLRDPNYDTLKLRLEVAHSAVEAAAVEARRRVRLNEGR